MTLDRTFAQFDQALNWNAALYIGYKIVFIVLSVTLFTVLPTNDYALWANINSIVFLFLLWIDCGMRKSVPRFCPEFKSTYRFISGVAIIQLFILLASTPWLYYSLAFITNSLHHELSTLRYLGVIIFLTQGIINTIRLLFHSYFLHKQFNLLSIVIMFLEMLFNLSLLFLTQTNNTLIYGLFINKIVADISLIFISAILMVKLFPTITNGAPLPDASLQPDTVSEQDTAQKKFITHSFMMWIAVVIKSFTERNFLVPFITYAVGPETANLFKVSNDIALAFYRFVLKTVGTADTSLLTYSNILNKKDELATAFAKLATKIVELCLPLVGIIMIINIYRTEFFDNQTAFQLFTIMSLCYLIETLLLPFERILEVKRSYYYLLVGYAPYAASILLLTNTKAIQSIGIVPFIILIHVIRLTSSFLVVFLSQRMHSVRFPFLVIARKYGIIKK